MSQTQPALAQTSVPGLVHLYSGNGNANDAVAGPPGALGATTAFGAGINGQAFSFNGLETSIVKLPVSINPADLPQMTMGMFVKLRSIPNNRGWVIGHDNGGYDRSLNLHDDRYGGPGAHVAGGTGSFSPYPSSLPFSVNQWHCVAVAYNAGAGTATFYVDGAVQTVSANPGAGDPNATLGGLQNFLGHTVDALVDEVFIFNRALTPQEINQVSLDLSNCNPLAPTAFSGLVSWWRAEGNFQDSFDGNHGFPVGTVGFVPGIGQAFSFNGSSAVAVPSSPSLNFGTGNFSGSFWVKTTAPTVGNFLVEKDIPGV